MTIDDLKNLFQGYCKSESSTAKNQMFGLEYENFILVPNKDGKNTCFRPLTIDGHSGVFSVMENLVELWNFGI